MTLLLTHTYTHVHGAHQHPEKKRKTTKEEYPIFHSFLLFYGERGKTCEKNFLTKKIHIKPFGCRKNYQPIFLKLTAGEQNQKTV
jgi:hypothetical protein